MIEKFVSLVWHRLPNRFWRNAKDLRATTCTVSTLQTGVKTGKLKFNLLLVTYGFTCTQLYTNKRGTVVAHVSEFLKVCRCSLSTFGTTCLRSQLTDCTCSYLAAHVTSARGWNVLEWMLQLFCFSNKGGGSIDPTVRRQRCYEWALCQTSSTTSRHAQKTPKKIYKICVFGFTLIPCEYPNPRSWVFQPKLAKPTVNWVSWALQRPAGSPASRHPLCRQNPQRHIHQDWPVLHQWWLFYILQWAHKNRQWRPTK